MFDQYDFSEVKIFVVFERMSGKMFSLVDAVLFYAEGVWGFREAFDCNSVQNHALRSFLGVQKYAAKVAIEGAAEWDP